MDELDELTGAVHSTFTCDEHQYKLGVLTASDWGEFIAYLLKDRPDPLAVVKPHLEGLSDKQQELLLERAYNDARLGKRLEPGELEVWAESIEGSRMRFWYAIRKHHPSIQFDEAWVLHDVYQEQKHEHLERLLQEINGLPKNSPGPEGASSKTDSQSAGEQSSAISAGHTTGPTSKLDE